MYINTIFVAAYRVMVYVLISFQTTANLNHYHGPNKLVLLQQKMGIPNWFNKMMSFDSSLPKKTSDKRASIKHDAETKLIISISLFWQVNKRAIYFSKEWSVWAAEKSPSNDDLSSAHSNPHSPFV